MTGTLGFVFLGKGEVQEWALSSGDKNTDRDLEQNYALLDIKSINTETKPSST